jgi:hypothetical protein
MEPGGSGLFFGLKCTFTTRNRTQKVRNRPERDMPCRPILAEAVRRQNRARRVEWVEIFTATAINRHHGRPLPPNTCTERNPWAKPRLKLVALANKGHDTRALQAYLGHRNIAHTVRYTELSPMRRCWTKSFVVGRQDSFRSLGCQCVPIVSLLVPIGLTRRVRS